ncbi:hypothetical protein [Romboutsia sp. 1001713B170131_170501_G6]|uniref:hypothetical protein n=1 Tax=Romboutsia sp. 1001713B170131_170501_G6 TaxID=2787108 RepID=UPI0018AA13AE|nr:hypothetical protein [Romboutsia sp. 1001713B170131_170501_G6]
MEYVFKLGIICLILYLTYIFIEYCLISYTEDSTSLVETWNMYKETKRLLLPSLIVIAFGVACFLDGGNFKEPLQILLKFIMYTFISSTLVLYDNSKNLKNIKELDRVSIKIERRMRKLRKKKNYDESTVENDKKIKDLLERKAYIENGTHNQLYYVYTTLFKFVMIYASWGTDTNFLILLVLVDFLSEVLFKSKFKDYRWIREGINSVIKLLLVYHLFASENPFSLVAIGTLLIATIVLSISNNTKVGYKYELPMWINISIAIAILVITYGALIFTRDFSPSIDEINPKIAIDTFFNWLFKPM